jgi:hypothetical protein
MKSVTERQAINGAKYTKEQVKVMWRSAKFLTKKYEAARAMFVMMWWLKLIRDKKWTSRPFGAYYYADKITQCHTFGKYNGLNSERGAHEPDPNSVCDVPAWFSEPV